MKYRRVVTLVLAAAILLLLFACATGGGSNFASEQDSETSLGSKVYIGVGLSDSLGGAIAAARVDVVRQAVVEIIGAEQESAQQEQLQESIYSGSKTSVFLDEETLEVLGKENLGTIDDPEFRYEISVLINRDRLALALENTAAPSAAQTAVRAAIDTEAGTVDTEESQYIERYLRNLSYMVYFREEADIDPFLSNSAVTQANSYLTEAGSTVFNRSQVEQLKRDAELVYEAEVGQEISLIQWVAQRLNADVYIELDATVSGRSGSDRHYGAASASLTMFESSTGQLLGSINRSSPETISRTSQQNAIVNALQSSIYGAMPLAVEQSQAQIGRIFERGIRYDLVLQSTADTRLITPVSRGTVKRCLRYADHQPHGG